MKTTLATAFAIAAMVAVTANAALIPITGVTASHGGDQYADGPISVINGSGITKADADDPSTWTFDGTAYGDELMSNFLSGALNSKIAWEAYDLGSAQALGTLHLFNTNYAAGVSGVDSFNIYYATTPTVALPAMPAKNTWSNTGLTPQGDYNFASGGWTQFGSTTAAPKADIGTYDMTTVTARYVAIEILSNHGDTYQGGRVGLDEVAITQGIPEPTSLALLGLAGVFLVRRRRG